MGTQSDAKGGQQWRLEDSTELTQILAKIEQCQDESRSSKVTTYLRSDFTGT